MKLNVLRGNQRDGDEKRLLSHPQCCKELLHKELLGCIEFIEWTAEMEM